MDKAIQNENPSSIPEELNEFQRVKVRLEEIANAVDGDELTLDQALDLYEEAVALGLQATDLLDVDITVQECACATTQEDASDVDAMQEASQEGAPDVEAVQNR